MQYFATREELAKLDMLAVKSELKVRQMMELAGWHMLEVFRKMNVPRQQKVVVLCGKGNKAGDGLCAARHLHNNGWQIAVVLMSTKLKRNTTHQLKLLKKEKISINYFNEGQDAVVDKINISDLVIDALIGYNLEGKPREKYITVLNYVSISEKPVIAYDIPTGIDATTGECFDPCIKAEATLTLALAKKAFKYPHVREKSGKIFLADIGIPNYLYDQIKDGIRPRFNGKQIEI